MWKERAKVCEFKIKDYPSPTGRHKTLFRVFPYWTLSTEVLLTKERMNNVFKYQDWNAHIITNIEPTIKGFMGIIPTLSKIFELIKPSKMSRNFIQIKRD